jgi:hypothetical protein
METMASARSDALALSPAALLFLKVSAFVLMLADHVDWLLGSGHGPHASIGRIVFPIFGVVLAYNMARTDSGKLLRTVAPRLAFLGLWSQLPYAFLQGGFLPLNILFTLAAAVAVFAVIDRGHSVLGLLLACCAGLFVDYAWIGVLGVVCVAFAFRNGGEWRAWCGIVGFSLSLTAINGNLWAILAVPVIWIVASCAQGDAPRMKWLFWFGYPAHLLVLSAARFLVQ